MTRPSQVFIDSTALLHNLNVVKHFAPGKKIIAMVKANAYGCGLSNVVSALDGHVDAFGVACLEEAKELRDLGCRAECVVFQGVFSPDEWTLAAKLNVQCVVHHELQVQWLLSTPLSLPIKLWIKIDTGMHRLGFEPSEVPHVIQMIQACSWTDKTVSLMTHFACADEPSNPANQQQYEKMLEFKRLNDNIIFSMANSAAVMTFKDSHADWIRPGIMLYGVSPFSDQIGIDLGLKPVMRFVSKVSMIRHYPAGVRVGYGGCWESRRPSTLGIISVGYGDGYPRGITPGTSVWVNGFAVPIVGQVCMDMLTIDLTSVDTVQIGDEVELWGQHIPIESVANSAGTIAYELLCQVTQRVR